MKQKNKKNKIFSKIFIIVIIIAICIYSFYEVIKLFISPTDIVTVENGKISSEVSTEGYIIREENVLKGENYKNGISQIKAEGEKVSKGENVFRYYTKDEESLIAKIKELDNQISEAESNESNIFSSDVKVIEEEIENKINEMYKINDIKKVQEYKNNIDEYEKKKTQIIGDLSPSGSYLKKLIKKRSEIETQLNSGSEYIKSNVSGVVSYKVDGYEEILSSNSLEKINSDLLNGLNVKTGQIIQNSTECGKIINNYYCYIAVVINSENIQDLSEGNNLKIRISNGDEVNAEIEKINEDKGNKKVVIFKITKDVEELLEYRKINLDIIFWDYSGLKVPNSSLIKENELYYVMRNRAGYKDKVLVKVKKQNENYSIIEDYTTEELKELGWSSSDIVNNKTINIYDEVIVHPNE